MPSGTVVSGVEGMWRDAGSVVRLTTLTLFCIECGPRYERPNQLEADFLAGLSVTLLVRIMSCSPNTRLRFMYSSNSCTGVL